MLLDCLFAFGFRKLIPICRDDTKQLCGRNAAVRRFGAKRLGNVLVNAQVHLDFWFVCFHGGLVFAEIKRCRAGKNRTRIAEPRKPLVFNPINLLIFLSYAQALGHSHCNGERFEARNSNGNRNPKNPTQARESEAEEPSRPSRNRGQDAEKPQRKQKHGAACRRLSRSAQIGQLTKAPESTGVSLNSSNFMDPKLQQYKNAAKLQRLQRCLLAACKYNKTAYACRMASAKQFAGTEEQYVSMAKPIHRREAMHAFHLVAEMRKQGLPLF